MPQADVNCPYIKLLLQFYTIHIQITDTFLYTQCYNSEYLRMTDLSPKNYLCYLLEHFFPINTKQKVMDSCTGILFVMLDLCKLLSQSFQFLLMMHSKYLISIFIKMTLLKKVIPNRARQLLKKCFIMQKSTLQSFTKTSEYFFCVYIIHVFFCMYSITFYIFDNR